MMNNWVVGASIAAIALIHAASSAFAADKPVYAVLLKSLSNQFFSAAAKGVGEGAKKKADVDIIVAEGRGPRPVGRVPGQRLRNDAGEEAGRDDRLRRSTRPSCCPA